MKWARASSLNEWEIIELIEHKDTIKKFFTLEMNWIKARLWNCKYKWKESEAYLALEILNNLAIGLDTIQKNYKNEKNKIEDTKE